MSQDRKLPFSLGGPPRSPSKAQLVPEEELQLHLGETAGRGAGGPVRHGAASAAFGHYADRLHIDDPLAPGGVIGPPKVKIPSLAPKGPPGVQPPSKLVPPRPPDLIEKADGRKDADQPKEWEAPTREEHLPENDAIGPYSTPPIPFDKP